MPLVFVLRTYFIGRLQRFVRDAADAFAMHVESSPPSAIAVESPAPEEHEKHDDDVGAIAVRGAIGARMTGIVAAGGIVVAIAVGWIFCVPGAPA